MLKRIWRANLKINVEKQVKKDQQTIHQFGEWALVVGAADGIGYGFSSSLASAGVNLILVDKNADLLTKLVEHINQTYRVGVKSLLLDLMETDAIAQLSRVAVENGCRFMVYVPAYSPVKPFLNHTPDELDRYMQINSKIPLHLVYHFLKSGDNRLPKGIILMSSLAGLIGAKWEAPYSATKGFNVLLAEALYHELKPQGVAVLACCAGMTDTPTFWSANPKVSGGFPGVMTPRAVADHAIKKLGKEPICIPGWKNRLSYFLLTRLFPRKFAGQLVAKSMEQIF